tara:strand:- start:6775 stop:9288 length:2514 start_codon:yes stop_codon:yes gene_type:complete
MKSLLPYLYFTSIFFFSVNTNSQNIKSPSEFLGYDLGTQFSRHHQVVDYFKYISEQLPNQIQLEKYGETNERRPLYLAYVGSEENIKNIEAIRKNNLRNTGVLDGTPTNNNIAIVWLSYNVHGNEASSTEVSMNTIYKLITEKQDWLKNTLVIIDPCINPDGRDRYANWYNETASNPYNIDQQASEHNEPWPGGRPNHYLFDLNRDWAWATQIETISRLKIYNTWLPHIHIDFHEQDINDPYYFAPAAEPFHEIISDWQRDFQTQIGKNHAKYFDAAGWLYFTKERFDLLYPSYGDTYPTYMGAIGMTYEQAGHGKGGLGVLNDKGDVLTLLDRIAHHTTTGLSTVEMASKHAEKINTEFKKFFDNSSLKYKSYVLQGPKDKIESLKSLLDKHDIKYGNASPETISGFNYANAAKGSIKTSENDLVVSTNQPKGKMVKVLFEPQTKLKDSVTYDNTAWSIPYAYGLQAIASEKLVKSNPVKEIALNNQINKTATGYIVNWNHLKDAAFLAHVLKQNIKIRFTEKPLKAEGKSFNRGSLIIIRGDNKKITDFDNILLKAATEFNRELHPIQSGFSASGPDFGSPDIKLVNKQKIAMLSGEGVSSGSYGALWHFFEKQLNYPIVSINTDDFSGIDLNKYHVLIMPNGNYKSLLNEKGLEKVQSWVKKGGKVIAISDAVSAFANKEGLNIKTSKTEDEVKKEKDTINLISYGDREREAIKKQVSGAIFKAKIDNTHPLAFGYGDNYFTFKLGSGSYKLLSGNNYNISYLSKTPEKVSGFAGSEAVKELKNSLVFGEERQGKGSIIYMVDDVMYRSFWENGKLFLVNAIFFVNSDAFSYEN